MSVARVWLCWECPKCGELMVTGPSETAIMPRHEHQESIYVVVQSAQVPNPAPSMTGAVQPS